MSARAVAVIRPAPISSQVRAFLPILSGRRRLYAYQSVPKYKRFTFRSKRKCHRELYRTGMPGSSSMHSLVSGHKHRYVMQTAR